MGGGSAHGAPPDHDRAERGRLLQLDRALPGELQAGDQARGHGRAAQQRVAQIVGQEARRGRASRGRSAAAPAAASAASGVISRRAGMVMRDHAAALHRRAVGAEQLGQAGPPERGDRRPAIGSGAPRAKRARCRAAGAPASSAAARRSASSRRSRSPRSSAMASASAQLALGRRQQELRLQVGEPGRHHEIFGRDLQLRAPARLRR